MSAAAAYRVPRAASRGEYREKGSRFLAMLERVATEAEARSAVERLRFEHSDASHHCWALRLAAKGLGAAPLERSADAGEPAGTAGVPILRVLRGHELYDSLLVVVRWFGGTKLGKGGLARAYAAAARSAVEGAAIELRLPVAELELEVEYHALGALQRIVHPPEVQLVAADYGDRVRVVLRVEASQLERVRGRLADLGYGTAELR